MNRVRTVLLMSRGRRLHHLFRELAADLARDHRVVVLAFPEEVRSLALVPGIEVLPCDTPDVVPGSTGGLKASDAEIATMASRIEGEIELPVYKAASNFLLYGRIVKSFGGRWTYLSTEREILRAYVGAYTQLCRLFERVQPDLIFYETIDLVSTYVAFALARRYEVFALEFRFSPLGHGRIFPAFGLFRRNIVLEHLYLHPEKICPASYDAADAILQDPSRHLERSTYAEIHRRMIDDQSPLNPRRVASVIRDLRRLRHTVEMIGWHFRTVLNRRWLARHISRTPPTGRYVVFFLQNLPEASTCSEAPRWVSQDGIVEQLAVNAPHGVKIVAKEHPRSYGRRGRPVFGPLAELPNVVLCHPSVDNRVLLAGAEAVLVVNGSVGLEALLLGKRVGVLGRPAYSIYEGVRTLDHPAEIFTAMADPSWRPESMGRQRRQFLAAYLQSLHDFGVGEGTNVFPGTGGGRRWAAALRQTMAFIEEHKLRPSDFVSGL